MPRPLIVLLASGIGLLFAGAAVFFWLLFSPVLRGSEDEDFTLKIKKGTSFDGIVHTLLQDSLLANETKLKMTARLLGLRNQIKAGKYNLAGGISSYVLLRKLVDGQVALETVTILEGKKAREIASILKREIEIDSTLFMGLVRDSTFARQLGWQVSSLEGFLFPDTYRFHWGINSREIVSIMVSEFNKQFDDSLRSRIQELGWPIQKAVALASIIEGEATIASERAIISAVYHNRLKRGMLLQADPTIQYIISGGPRRLLNRDLEIDSPYNTYKYAGLPPGPINNPGAASIRASLFPADVDYLYFVANGDGSHTFSRTFEEHLKAKARFDRIRQKVKRQKQATGEDG